MMLARAAERNPSVFLSSGHRCNLKEVIPLLLNLAQYLDNPWGNTKFLLTQFKPSPAPISNTTKAERKAIHLAIGQSKSVDQVAEQLGVELGRGKAILDLIDAELLSRTATARSDEVDA